jgi:hypothetical protein
MDPRTMRREFAAGMFASLPQENELRASQGQDLEDDALTGHHRRSGGNGTGEV